MAARDRLGYVGEGVSCWGREVNLALVPRRLAIVDLPAWHDEEQSQSVGGSESVRGSEIRSICTCMHERWREGEV